MSLSERAAAAAADAGRTGPPDPPDREGFWRRFEEDATAGLRSLLEDDPGPAMRLEPGTKAWAARASAYPPSVGRDLLVFFPDGHEIVANTSKKYFLVRRSQNPNEEAMLARIRSLADLGEAIS